MDEERRKISERIFAHWETMIAHAITEKERDEIIENEIMVWGPKWIRMFPVGERQAQYDRMIELVRGSGRELDQSKEWRGGDENENVPE